jgi:hypothetical protein
MSGDQTAPQPAAAMSGEDVEKALDGLRMLYQGYGYTFGYDDEQGFWVAAGEVGLVLAKDPASAGLVRKLDGPAGAAPRRER